ncbi:hypothetical protein [Paraburkholderia phosphatilytica]|uniref:hypothetical protein n=1 Tax=Paraburkholderia phosphatilytica TaxID=2282883 RepID=UPI000F5F1138|nr:hypothetical protein [Paraburkholderia phosphatilytica]
MFIEIPLISDQKQTVSGDYTRRSLSQQLAKWTSTLKASFAVMLWAFPVAARPRDVPDLLFYGAAPAALPVVSDPKFLRRSGGLRQQSHEHIHPSPRGESACEQTRNGTGPPLA